MAIVLEVVEVVIWPGQVLQLLQESVLEVK